MPTLKDLQTSLSNEMQLPKNRYQMRCIKESFGPNKKSVPMYTREWEIVTPTANIKGTDVEIAGTKLTQRSVLKSLDGEVKSESCLKRVLTDLKVMGIITEDENVNPEKPPVKAEGIVVDAIIGSEKYSPMMQRTVEQIAAGWDEFDERLIIKDGSGKPIINYRPNLERILGVAAA